jgi:arylsulfatase A-like enzyme
MRYIRTRDWKLVTYVDDTTELYDLRSDPHELTNLGGERGLAEVRLKLANALIEQMMTVSNPGVETDSVS